MSLPRDLNGRGQTWNPDGSIASSDKPAGTIEQDGSVGSPDVERHGLHAEDGLWADGTGDNGMTELLPK